MAIESIVAGDAVPSGYHRRGEALIHADARIAEDAILAGPLFIGQGAEVHSGAVVIGPTSIGCDAVINDGALVSRSAVWRRSVIQAGATADLCILGDGAVIQTHRPEQGRPVWPNSASRCAGRVRLGRRDESLAGLPRFRASLPWAIRRVAVADPIGRDLLVSRLCDRVQAVTSNNPVILAPQMSGPAYRATMSAACPEATILSDAGELVDSLPPLECRRPPVRRRSVFPGGRRGDSGVTGRVLGRAPDQPSSRRLRGQHLRHEGTREHRRCRPSAQHPPIL